MKFLTLLLLSTFLMFSCTKEDSQPQLETKQQVSISEFNFDYEVPQQPSFEGMEIEIQDLSIENENELLEQWNNLIPDSEFMRIKHLTVIRTDGNLHLYGIGVKYQKDESGFTDPYSTPFVSVSATDIYQDSKGYVFQTDSRTDGTVITITCSGCNMVGPASVGYCEPKKNEEGKLYCTKCADWVPNSECKTTKTAKSNDVIGG